MRKHFYPVIYGCLSIFILLSLFMMIDTYCVHLKVETSVVSAPIEAFTSPLDGLIQAIYVRVGQRVQKGDALIKIENFKIEETLNLARLEKKDAEYNLAYLKNLLKNENDKLALYKAISGNRMISNNAEVGVSEDEMQAAKKQLARMRTLHVKHYITNAEWDDALTKFAVLQEHSKRAQALREIESHSQQSLAQGFYFTGDKVEGNANELKAQIDLAQNKLNLSQAKVKLYEAALEKLTLKAPFDGVVNQILKSVGSATDTTKPLILLTALGQKSVVAYLTQDEITHIKMFGKVKVYIPALTKTYTGKVVNVDRTSGFVDVMNAQYRWRDLEIDRSAAVRIDLDHASTKLFAGMPAIVYFSRKINF